MVFYTNIMKGTHSWGAEGCWRLHSPTLTCAHLHSDNPGRQRKRAMQLKTLFYTNRLRWVYACKQSFNTVDVEVICASFPTVTFIIQFISLFLKKTAYVQKNVNPLLLCSMKHLKNMNHFIHTERKLPGFLWLPFLSLKMYLRQFKFC